MIDPIGVSSTFISDAMISLLSGELGRERPECVWMTTSSTPGVGCCDSIQVRNTKIEEIRSDGGTLGPFIFTFDIRVTRCKPKISGSRDALSTAQEADLATDIQAERWALQTKLVEYIELRSDCANIEISPISTYDDETCVGSIFKIRFRVTNVDLQVWSAMQFTSDLRPIVQDFLIREGDDFRHTYTFRDSSKALVDVTAWGFVGYIDPSDGSPSVSLTVTHDSDGVVTISATAAEMAGVVVGTKHEWDLKRGDTNETLFAGKFKVYEDKALA